MFFSMTWYNKIGSTLNVPTFIKRLVFFLLVVQTGLIFPSQASGQVASLPATPISSAHLSQTACAFTKDWVGRYPSDRLKATELSLLDQSCLSKPLQRIMPAAAYQVWRSRLVVEAKVKQIGSYLLVERCEAHACPAHDAMVVLDLESGRVVAAIFERRSHSTITTWYADDMKPLVLPEAILNEFQDRH